MLDQVPSPFSGTGILSGGRRGYIRLQLWNVGKLKLPESSQLVYKLLLGPEEPESQGKAIWDKIKRQLYIIRPTAKPCFPAPQMWFWACPRLPPKGSSKDGQHQNKWETF